MCSSLVGPGVNPGQQPFLKRKKEGLLKRKPKQAHYIFSIEKLWENYALNNRPAQQLERLLEKLKFTISRKAAAAGRRWNNKRIPAADFESAFWHEAWRVSDSYHQYTDFYFYETLCLGFERREIDVVRRHTKSRQKAFEIGILPLSKAAESFLPSDLDIEKTVTDHLLVQQVMNNSVLLANEANLLQVMYENPAASYREVAVDVGAMHHEKVRRMLIKIKNKFWDYGDYL